MVKVKTLTATAIAVSAMLRIKASLSPVMYARSMPGNCAGVKTFLSSVAPVTTTSCGLTPSTVWSSLFVNRDWPTLMKIAPEIVWKKSIKAVTELTSADALVPCATMTGICRERPIPMPPIAWYPIQAPLEDPMLRVKIKAAPMS